MPEGEAVGKEEVKNNAVSAAVRKASLLPFVFVMYAYATGERSSRRIERRCVEDVASCPRW